MAQRAGPCRMPDLAPRRPRRRPLRRRAHARHAVPLRDEGDLRLRGLGGHREPLCGRRRRLVSIAAPLRADCGLGGRGQFRSGGTGASSEEFEGGGMRAGGRTSSRGIMSRMLGSPSTVKQSASLVSASSWVVHSQRWFTLKATRRRRQSLSRGITPRRDSWSIRVEVMLSGVMKPLGASAWMPPAFDLPPAGFFLAAGVARLTMTGILNGPQYQDN